MLEIPGYQILMLLYRGSHNLNYLARNETTGKLHWIKKSAAIHPTPNDQAMVQQECDASAAVAEHGFPRFSPLRQFGNTLASVSTQVHENGQTLRQWIDAADGPLSVTLVLRVALSLVHMLDAFHRKNLVHNNVNPETLWIDPETLTICPIDYSFVRESGSLPSAVYARLSDIRHGAYISPEQTGRLSRGIDTRSDLYALGVMMYEMLTRRLPLEAEDPLQWLHAHVAQEVVAPQTFRPDLPQPVARIVMKCLQKIPDERYQSIYGLKADLERCLEQATDNRWLTDFQPAASDPPIRLRLTERFIGRSSELDRLRRWVERADMPPSKLVLLSGEPGIGKTRLLLELKRKLSSPERLFLYGKFDQVNRDLPFRPWIDAFHQWVQYVLAQGEEEISSWRRLIKGALGAHVPILVQLIPQLEQIVGSQHPSSDKLSGVELENRFQAVLAGFLRLFGNKGITLVVILDDLQWIDPGSAKLLQSLLAQNDLSHVLCVGTYREESEEKQGIWPGLRQSLLGNRERVNHMRLRGMGIREIMAYLSATFHCPMEKTRALASYLHAKTEGNPYFLREYLHVLCTAGHISYDPECSGWTWRLQGMMEMGPITERLEVGRLLANKLSRLSEEGQRLIRYAACVGNRFELSLLARLADGDAGRLQKALKEMVELGLILPAGTKAYVFAHDQVRLAAYSLIGAEERERVHGQIGLFMLDTDPLALDDERLFDIVNHLNLGKAFLDAPRTAKLAELNLLAGHRARTLTVFMQAREYYKTGLSCLSQESWAAHYRLTFELKMGCMECAYLLRDDVEVARLYEEVLEHAESVEDRAQAHVILITALTRAEKYELAIAKGLEALAELGVSIPRRPTKAHILWEWLKVKRFTAGTGIERLKQMPPATDGRRQLIMEIIFGLGPPTYLVNPNLMFYLALRSCRLTMQYGIFHNSGIGFMVYGILTAFQMGDIATGLKWGEAAWRITLKYGTSADKGYAATLYGAFLHHWGHPPEASEAYLLQAIEYCAANGDLLFAGYAVTHLLASLHVRGVNLEELEEEVGRYDQWTDRMRDPHFLDFLVLYKHFVRNLQGKTENVYRLDDGDFREDAYVDSLSDERKKFDYWLCKVQALYLLGQWEEAWKFAEQAQRHIQSFAGIISAAELDYYYCLLLLGRMDSLDGKEKRRLWRVVQKKEKQFRMWSKANPCHYRHKWLLMQAEMARAAGDEQRAVYYYELAADEAGRQGYTPHAAIAHECAARFYKMRQYNKAFERHLLTAYQLYMNWGAYAKTHRLLNQHPWLSEAVGRHSAGHWRSRQPLAPVLDVAALLQASQAISRETELEALLKEMLRIVLQHSGADRAYLLLEDGGEWAVAARGVIAAHGLESCQLEWTPLGDCPELDTQVIEYVARTREALVLDPVSEGKWVGLHDLHGEGRALALLCMPIMQGGKLTAILYLENHRNVGVFTLQRTEVLKLLSTQMAISIQNAITYDRLRTANFELEGTVAETAVSLEQSRKEAAGALIEKAILEERSRIAGEIHDTVGHALTSALVQLEASKKLLARKELDGAMEKLVRSQQQIREGLKNLRSSLWLLREGGESPEEFVPALESFIRKTMEYTGVQVDYEIGSEIKLTSAQKYVLYRALQEGITNGIRHGEAKRFEFLLRQKGQQIEFFLRDDGKGAEEPAFGIGLSTMRERVRELNGWMELQSVSGKGCALSIRLPVHNKSS